MSAPMEGPQQDGAPDPGGRVGEVVRSSSTEFETECYRLNCAPPIGALVACGEDDLIFGVVADSVTESLDPSRTPVPKGADLATESEVYSTNPQLSRLLATRFTSVAVGHLDAGVIRWRLAPSSPRILSFVRVCSGDEVRDFSASVAFLPDLLGTRVGSPDQVAAAFIRRAAASHPEPREFIVRAGKELAVRLPGQLRRVAAILRMAAE